MTATDQLYYRADGASICISDDVRTLYKRTDPLDDRGIYSLLQFRAIVPPLSPWKEIRRLVPGKTTIFFEEESFVRVREEPACRPTKSAFSCVSLDEQISTVVSALDRILVAAAETHPVVVILFSGGVDSALLAARAAHLGIDAILLNYCFGPNDTESAFAEEVARHLRLNFIRIDQSGEELSDLLEHAGEYYRIPFCDHSTLPTCALVRSVISRFPSRAVVFEGTGADGAFGFFAKVKQWQHLYAIPVSLRRIGAAVYKLSLAWEREARAEYWLRLLRRSVQFTFPLATVGNALRGIAYDAKPEIHAEVEAMALDWISSFSTSDPRVEMAALDLALVCSSIFAQKSKSLFAGGPTEVVYPFLDPEMVDIALASSNWPGSESEPKWVLKAALARHIPREMVYRPKSGFVAPLAAKFRQTEFLAAFDKLLEPASFMNGLVAQQFLRRVRPKLVHGYVLPEQTACFVWGVVFANEWLNQVQELKGTPLNLNKADAVAYFEHKSRN